LNISSTHFHNNHGLNGGAIYFGQPLSDNYNVLMEIEDTLFTNNEAKYFGGSIYLEFIDLNFLNIKNLNFSMNHAYSGGAIYIENTKIQNYNRNRNKNIYLNINENKNITYHYNLAESHGDNYATGPYKIIHEIKNPNDLTFISGEEYQLKFVLKDIFNQTITDISKYYRNIILNLNMTIIEGSGQNKIIGNTCYFSKGNKLCKLYIQRDRYMF